MKKYEEYSFLREEMQNLSSRQDNMFSTACATVAVLWTLSISVSNEWIALLSIFVSAPMLLRICDLRYGAVFLGAYLKICLEGNDDWETIRTKYYKTYPMPFKIVAINRISKTALPLINIISCVIFWILRDVSLREIFGSFLNIAIIVVQIIICIGLWLVWNKFANPKALQKTIENNWLELKEKYINKADS